jgi:hypothetical protein
VALIFQEDALAAEAAAAYFRSCGKVQAEDRDPPRPSAKTAEKDRRK